MKYSIIELKNGLFRPQREYGDRMLYPAFETLHDAILFMKYTVDDFEPGIVGKMQIIRREA